MQPRLRIEVLTLEAQVLLHRVALGFPAFELGVAYDPSYGLGRVVDLRGVAPGFIGRLPDDPPALVGQFARRAQVVGVEVEDFRRVVFIGGFVFVGEAQPFPPRLALGFDLALHRPGGRRPVFRVQVLQG